MGNYIFAMNYIKGDSYIISNIEERPLKRKFFEIRTARKNYTCYKCETGIFSGECYADLNTMKKYGHVRYCVDCYNN